MVELNEMKLKDCSIDTLKKFIEQKEEKANEFRTYPSVCVGHFSLYADEQQTKSSLFARIWHPINRSNYSEYVTVWKDVLPKGKTLQIAVCSNFVQVKIVNGDKIKFNDMRDE